MENVKDKLKFKIGERVKVKKDLEIGVRYYMEDENVRDMFTEKMAKNCGKEATIVNIIKNKYVLDIDNFHLYTDGMLNKFVDVKAKSDYKHNDEIEALLENMLKLVPQQQIDYALDNGDKELFHKLRKKYFSDAPQ